MSADAQRSRLHQPGSLMNPGWFKIASGPHAGRWHLSGWMKHAVLTLPTGSRNDSPEGVWLSISICPLCHATVISEDFPQFAYGNQEWAHEQWHHETDFPHPAE